MSIRVTMIAVVVAVLALYGAGTASAQPQQQQQQQPQQRPKPAPQQPQQPQQPGVQQGGAQQPGQGAQPEPVEGTTLSTSDHSPESEEPKPPNEADLDELGKKQRAEVALGAGEGSDIAYARATVVELGGVLALTHASDTTVFRIAPSVGYFVIDNIELTLFPEVSVVDVNGESDVTVGAVLEPSYHLPFNDDLFGFLGVGFGLRYAKDPGVDFALRPKLGMDIMIGRSGILKPAAFLDIGANDGLTQGGLEAGFTVML